MKNIKINNFTKNGSKDLLHYFDYSCEYIVPISETLEYYKNFLSDKFNDVIFIIDNNKCKYVGYTADITEVLSENTVINLHFIIKDLDMEDIESCGFVKSHGNDNIVVADYRNTKEEIFFMVYNFNTKVAIVSIGKRLDCGCPDTRFKGKIENIHELKNILKQIQ